MTHKGATVIVVEDETIVRMDIVMSLEDEGFLVLEASNADEAIGLLDTHPEIRLMFTDIDMPGSMDGLKLAEAVRKASGLPQRGQDETAQAAAEVGAAFEPALSPEDKSPARWAYERMVQYIRNFEAQLNANEEVAMGFAGSDAGVVSIEGLGYYDPDILTFYGRDEEGMKTQLVQHVTQLSVILRAAPKVAPEIPARRIGFHLAPGWTGGEAGDGSA